MHHFMDTELHCAPPICVVQETYFLIRGHPNIFHFLVVDMEHAENGHFLSVFGGSQGQTTDTLFGTMLVD